MACVAVHPDYRSSCRGEVLLQRISTQAKQMGLDKLFVLTTRSIHWFQEKALRLLKSINYLLKNRLCIIISVALRS